MDLISKQIRVTKTARYFLNHNDNESVSEVFFVLHGYGMQAGEFLKKFTIIDRPETLIVAPEGLSRFYRKAFAGDVVASWMTKDERLNEIDDYIGYLDNLYTELVKTDRVKVYVIGFSQGASTASRWVMAGNRRFNGLVLWSGEFAPDIVHFNSNLKTIWNVIGSMDEFITMIRAREQTQYLENKGFIVNEVVFEGNHDIDEVSLKKVWEELHSRL